MAWDREKRGIFQRKQEKPQIKKHKPLDSEGNDGDISIRQLKDGVFLFFKALGKWYKTLNTSSQVIPEPDAPRSLKLGSPAQPVETMYVSENSLHIGNTKSEQGKVGLSSDKTDLTFKNKDGVERKVIGKKANSNNDPNAIDAVTLGEDNVVNKQGWLSLGSGGSYYGGVLQGVESLLNIGESAYLGVRIPAKNTGGKALSIVGSTGFAASKLYLGLGYDTTPIGLIGFKDEGFAPGTPDSGYGIFYVNTDKPYFKDDNGTAYDLTTAATGVYLPLSGSTMTGHLNMGAKKFTGADRVEFNKGTGYISEIIDNDDMSSTGSTKVSSSESIKAYVDNYIYPGQIIGYSVMDDTDIHYTKTLTIGFVVTDAKHYVTFTAPTNGKAEIMVQIYLNSSTSNETVTFGLSDSATYNTLGASYEQIVSYADRTDDRVIQVYWVLTGLTAGNSYTLYLGAKATIGTTYLNWGGTGSGRYVDFIMKAIALP